MSTIAAAYTCTKFCHNPPHMMVVAHTGSRILLVRHEETDANGEKQTVLTLPGRELVYVPGNIMDSEYMYGEDGPNNVGLKNSASNILAEAVGPSLKTKKVTALTRDQHGLLIPDHETIVCVAAVKLSDDYFSNIRGFMVDQEEMLAKDLDLEAAKKLHAQRSRATWWDAETVFKNIKRQKDLIPFFEPKGSHAFTLEALYSMQEGTKQFPITSATVSILDALYKNNHFNDIGLSLCRAFITPQDKKEIAAHFKKLETPTAGS